MSQNNLTFSLNLDTDGLQSGINEAKSSIQGFTDKTAELGQSVTNDMNKTASAIADASNSIAGIGDNPALQQISAEFQRLNEITPQTSKQFKDMRTNYKELLNIMADNGLANTEEYAKVRDALSELDGSFKEFQKTAQKPIDVKIADISTEASNASKELKQAESLMRQLANGTASASPKSIEELVQKVAQLRDKVEKNKKKFEEFNQQVEAVRNKDFNLTERLAEITNSTIDANAQLKQAEQLLNEVARGTKEVSPEEMNILVGAVADLRDRAEESNKKVAEVNASVEALRSQRLTIANQLAEITSSGNTASEQLKEVESIVNEIASGAREVSDEEFMQLANTVADLRDKTEQSKSMLDAFNATVSKIQNQRLDVDQKIDKIKKSAKDANQASTQLKEELRKVLSENGGNVKAEEVKKLANEIANCDRQTQKLEADLNRAINSAKGFNLKDLAKGLDMKMLGGMGAQALTALASPMGAATAGAVVLGKVLYDAGKAAADFETHLDSLQALTGMTNEEMEVMSDKALKLGNEFGMAGGEVVDAMKLIGSQAPELLKNGDALEEVTKNCATLSKASQIDLVSASSAVTTAMNQMGVSASETGKLINTLAAGSQQGSADVSYLSRVFEKAGTSAKQAGMDFTSLTAIIETVGPKFSSADVAGTQLNSVLLKLSMSGKREFMPSMVGMSEALENLAKAEMSDAEMKALVGESGVTMLKAMIDGKEAFNSYNETLRDTNTAQEQYITNTDNMHSVVEKMKASWQNFLVILGQTGVMQEVAGNIQAVVKFLTDVIQKVGSVINAFKMFKSAGVSINTFQIQLELLKRQIDSILTAVEIVVRLIAKAWNWCVEQFENAVDWAKNKWEDLKSAMLKVEWIKAIYDAFKKAVENIGKAIDWIKDKWNDFLEWLGMSVDRKTSELSSDTATVNVDADTSALEKSFDDIKNDLNKLEEKLKTVNDLLKGDITDDKVKELNAEKKQIEDQIKLLQKKRGLETKTGKSSSSKKQTGELGSIVYLQQQIQKLDKELTGKKLSDERVKAIQSEKAEIQKQIDLLDVRNKLAGATGSIKQMQEAYNALGQVLENNKLTQEEIEDIIADRTAIQKRINDERVRSGLVDYQIGSIAYEEALLSDIENKLKNINLTEEERNKLLSERQSKLEEIAQMKIDGGLAGYEKNSLSDLQNQLNKAKESLNNKNLSEDELKQSQQKISELENRIEELTDRLNAHSTTIKQYKPKTEADYQRQNKQDSRDNYKANFENWRKSVKLGDMDISEFEDKMSEMKSLWEKEFPDSKLPLEYEIKDGKIRTSLELLEDFKKQMSDIGGVVGNVGGAFSQLGDAIGGSAGEMLKFASSGMQAIAQLLPQIATLISAKEAEATASAGAEAAKAQPWFMIPVAIATVIGTIASIFGSLPKFAQGGIVPNSVSQHGDNLLVRANPGEMLLNQQEQSRLFRMLNGKESGKSELSGSVKFEIEADRLVGTLNNYNKKMKRIK